MKSLKASAYRYYKIHMESRSISKEDFIVEKNSNLFVGGLTGRSGTTWLINLLGDLLQGKHCTIGETGLFVLSQFRHAAYEYYQPTPGSDKNKKSYLHYFSRFITKYGYNRLKIYGEGLRGLSQLLVTKRAIKLALEALQEELGNAQNLEDCNICFGDFYSRLLNFHSLLTEGTVKWISKEPGYGRHIDDLYHLIPDCRVVIMVRDGGDVALSMAKRGWCGGEIRKCINRWDDFAQMTLQSLQNVPEKQYLLVKYEDLVLNFEENISKILTFLNLEISEQMIRKLKSSNYKFKPMADNSGEKWEKTLSPEEIRYFRFLCGASMRQLGYDI